MARSVLLFAGWTANLWFAGAVIAGLAHGERAWALAAAAVVTAFGGVLAVVSMSHAARIGIGSWLWLGAMIMVACSATVWRKGERGSPRSVRTRQPKRPQPRPAASSIDHPRGSPMPPTVTSGALTRRGDAGHGGGGRH